MTHGGATAPAASGRSRARTRSTRPGPAPSAPPATSARSRAGCCWPTSSLDAANLAAEQASEAYNGALWRLAAGHGGLPAAQADAARARRTVAGQRDRIGALVAQSYQDGGDLTALNAMMGADGPQGVLDQYAAFQGASTALQADYQRFAASDSLAQVFETQGPHAKAEQIRFAAAAERAQQQAAARRRRRAGPGRHDRAEKDRLIHELA